MKNLTFENNLGERVEFRSLPFLIDTLNGIGEVESQHNDQTSPYQDGSSYIDSILSPRFIDLEGRLMKINYKDTQSERRHLINVCNPKKGLGNLIYELEDGSKRVIKGIPNVPAFPDNERDPWQSFTIEWFCPNPYWRSPNETTKPLVAYTGNFKLPTKFPFKLGKSGSKTTLYNNGDVPAPVRIEIHGPTTNPQIINRTTGEYIKINRTIAEGEVMHINTESGSKRITIIDENGNESSAFGYLDDKSDLFYLELGENIIEHVADAGNRHAKVIVRWDDMFVGV